MENKSIIKSGKGTIWAGILAAMVLLSAMTSCSSVIKTESISAKPPKTVAVDGDDVDWREPMLYDEKSDLLVGVKNDNENLYVCIKTANEATIRRLMTTGISLWFNNQGNDEKSFGLNFPMGSMNQARPIPGLAPKDSMPPMPHGDMRPPECGNMRNGGMPPPQLGMAEGGMRPTEDGSVPQGEMRPPRPDSAQKAGNPPGIPIVSDRGPDGGHQAMRERHDRPDPLKNAMIFIEKNRNQIGIARADLESKYRIKTCIKQKDRFLIYELSIPLEKSEYFDLSSAKGERIGLGITAPEIKRLAPPREMPEADGAPSGGPKMGGERGGAPGGMGGGMPGGMRGGNRGGGMGGHRGGGAPGGPDGQAQPTKENTSEIEIWYNVELAR